MSYADETFISTNDLLFKGILHDIKKSKVALQPVFEAFTNSIESLKIRMKSGAFLPRINIEIHRASKTDEVLEFSHLVVTDNGIGFNEGEFKRFNTFKDFTKGYKNLGSGRIQFAHHFDKTYFRSRFEENGKIFERDFVVSKSEGFLAKNAIVLHRFCKEVNGVEIETRVTFRDLIENSQIYHELTDSSLKTSLLTRYVHSFCHNKKELPAIEIKSYVDGAETSSCKIESSDIPDIDKSESLMINYSKFDHNKKSLAKTDASESFNIDAFKIKKDLLKTNKLNLVSKGEVVEDDYLNLEGLSEIEQICGYRYLFLVSSNYIDARDSDVRGDLKIPTKEAYSRDSNLFAQDEIFIDEIGEAVNAAISQMYPEVKETKEEHNRQYAALKEMFLLDDEASKSISVSINDSESKILEKFYEHEAKKTAQVDAEIKSSIDKLGSLDPRAENYEVNLKHEVDKLVKTIPIQNRNSLTHYVARRKLVLELFDKILKRQIDAQASTEGNFDEALLHNLLFQQGSDDPSTSDLWIISEEFIYFKGASEKRLSKLVIDGKPAFKDKFSEEEERYLVSLGENRKIKRPDVLLFPEEGRCIIIEFKAPEVNVSEHLTQIDFYASMIRNHTIDELKITSFYGYLIGEAIEPRDVLARVSRFEHSYQLGYLYRPSEIVHGFDGRESGSLYTEVIKYSVLLKRAQMRNKIYLDKLQGLR